MGSCRGSCKQRCTGFNFLAVLTILCTGVAAAGWVVYVVGLSFLTNQSGSSLTDYTGFSNAPIWAVAVGAPFGVVAILVQTFYRIYRVRNKVAILVWSPIFIFFLTYLMVFCGNLLYLLSVDHYHFHPDPASTSTPIIVMFTGVLVITVFEGGALVFLVMLMQWKKKAAH